MYVRCADASSEAFIFLYPHSSTQKSLTYTLSKSKSCRLDGTFFFAFSIHDCIAYNFISRRLRSGYKRGYSLLFFALATRGKRITVISLVCVSQCKQQAIIFMMMEFSYCLIVLDALFCVLLFSFA